METADNANQADYRIFGWDEQGRLRAVLYHGAGHPYAGARYSSAFGATVYVLADKLERIWEQPLSDAEWDAVQWLIDSRAEGVCQDCAGQGFDVGSIDPQGETCRTCKGSGIEPVTETPCRTPGIEQGKAAKTEAA